MSYCGMREILSYIFDFQFRHELNIFNIEIVGLKGFSRFVKTENDDDEIPQNIEERSIFVAWYSLPYHRDRRCVYTTICIHSENIENQNEKRDNFPLSTLYIVMLKIIGG